MSCISKGDENVFLLWTKFDSRGGNVIAERLYKGSNSEVIIKGCILIYGIPGIHIPVFMEVLVFDIA